MIKRNLSVLSFLKSTHLGQLHYAFLRGMKASAGSCKITEFEFEVGLMAGF